MAKTKKIDPISSKNAEQFWKLMDKIKHGSGRGFEGVIYLILDGEEMIGKIAIRAVDSSEGVRCETGMALYGTLADRKTDADGLHIVVSCSGYGYNMEAENMMTIMALLRPWLLERGFSYLSPSEKDYNFYMVNNWENVFKQRGYRLIRAL